MLRINLGHEIGLSGPNLQDGQYVLVSTLRPLSIAAISAFVNPSSLPLYRVHSGPSIRWRVEL